MVMEERINIAEILKNKPKGTKLYADAFGELSIEDIYTENTEDKDELGITLSSEDEDELLFYNDGKYNRYGEPILVPSKSMRDWRKFNWQKGDVLVSKDNVYIIFEEFEDDAYTRFKGKHYLWKECDEEDYNKEETKMLTSVFEKANDDAAQTYINTIEEKLGGKLNRETLEIENAEFKDGDIVSLEIRYVDSEDVIVETYIVHSDYNYGEELNFYAGCNDVCMIKHNSCVKPTNTSDRNVFIRYATDFEKQQLFDTLAKEGKAWDAEKKQVVDLKPKTELKPFDKVLVRDSKSDKWRANLFGYYIDKDEYYHCVYANWVYCIPYAGNESLLGTTKDVEG